MESYQSTIMFREILESPTAIRATLEGINPVLRPALDRLSKSKLILITGNGTSYHAGMVLQLALVRMGLPAAVVRASEFGDYLGHNSRDSSAVLISQSGENVDVMSAHRKAQESGLFTISITNNDASFLARNSNISIVTRAGEENSLAATKSFVAQLAVVYAISRSINGMADPEQLNKISSELQTNVKGILKQHERICSLASSLSGRLIFLGNGPLHAIAMEGALKFEETAGMVTEAYPIGEYLHGPIHILNREDTVVLLDPDGTDDSRRVIPRIGEITKNIITMGHSQSDTILLPKADDPMADPIYHVIPIQLLANSLTVLRGLSPDKPDRLNKVVR